MFNTHKSLMTLAIVGSATLAPQALAGFNVTLASADSAKQVALSFSTTETFSSMCHMETTELSIVAPKHDWQTDTDVAPGKITIVASTNPRTICLMAFGPHRGGVTLARGRALPAIGDGSYDLTINGVAVGSLALAEAGATFTKVDEAAADVRRFSGDMIASTLLDALRLYVEVNGEVDGVTETADHGILVNDTFVDKGTSLKCFEKQAGAMLPAFMNVCEVTLSPEAAAEGRVEGSLVASVIYDALSLYNQRNPGSLVLEGDQLVLNDDVVSPGAAVKAYTQSAGPHLPAFTYVVEFQFPPN